MLNKIKDLIYTNREGDILYKKWDIRFRDEFFNKVYWTYFPITEKYFFEGNPAFLYEFNNLFDLGRYPITMIRDGFVGLLDFFLVHPIPNKDMCSTILIHKKFESLIPKQWEDFVGVYTIKPREKELSNPKETLIIHGIATEDLFWKKSAKEIASDCKKIAADFKNVIFLLPQRKSILSTVENQQNEYTILLLKAIYEDFGFNVRIEMQVKEFFSLFKESSFYFYNLDQINAFVSDDFIDHYFYSRGGENILDFDSSPSEKSLEYHLSQNHKIIIETPNFSKNNFSKFYLPHKLSNRKEVSLYDIYKSNVFKELYCEYF